MQKRYVNQSFKDALHECVFRSQVPPKEIAARTGISYGRLSNYCNENQDESHIPGKHLVPVTLASESTGMIEYLCFCVGGVFVPVSDECNLKINKAKDEILGLVSEIGILAVEVTKAAEDGTIDSEEGTAIERILIRLAQRSIRLNEAIVAGLEK